MFRQDPYPTFSFNCGGSGLFRDSIKTSRSDQIQTMPLSPYIQSKNSKSTLKKPDTDPNPTLKKWGSVHIRIHDAAHYNLLLRKQRRLNVRYTLISA